MFSFIIFINSIMNILTYKDLIKGEDQKNDKYERLQTTSYIHTRESYDDSNKIINGLNEEIFIYPNPSNDYIDINNDEEIWKLEIINMNGEKIDVKRSGSRIDVSFLSKGIYILNFNNNFIKFVKN